MRTGLAALSILALAACGSPDPAATQGGDAPPAAPPAVALSGLAGDAARGEAVFVRCKACHTVEPGRNLIGPSLHGVVGRNAASVAGFPYSPALQSSGKVWDRETLYGWLESPAMQTPGTRMAFNLVDPQERADVIAWLETQQ